MTRINIISFLFGFLGLAFGFATWKPEIREIAYETSRFDLNMFEILGEDVSVEIDTPMFEDGSGLRTKTFGIKNVGNVTLLAESVRSKLHVSYREDIRVASPFVRFATNPDEANYECVAEENNLFVEFDVLDPEQGFECSYYLLSDRASSLVGDDIRERVGGRVQNWSLVSAKNRYEFDYGYAVAQFVWLIVGVLAFVIASWAMEATRYGKAMTKLTRVVTKHDVRMEKIQRRVKKKFDLIHGFRSRFFVFLFLTLVVLALCVVASLWFGSNATGFSNAIRHLFGFHSFPTDLFD